MAEELSAERMMEYREAFDYFQNPAPKGGKLTGLLPAERLPQALGAMGMAMPDDRSWALIVKEHRFTEFFPPHTMHRGFVTFEDYVFLLTKGPALVERVLQRVQREDEKVLTKKERLYKAFEVFDPNFVQQIPESTFMEVFANKSLELDCDANEFKELLAHTGLQGYSNKKIVDYQKLIDYLLTEDHHFE